MPQTPTDGTAECFLCRPESSLIYDRGGFGFALCGLGPLVAGYSVIGTTNHVPSAADLGADEAPEFLQFVQRVRENLIQRYGSCMMTEHGRLPVCVDVSGSTDPHCYHAHFLLFPGVQSLETKARGYFASAETVTSLEQALVAARFHQEYFLFSPSPQRFLVMTRPGKLMRQFARYLVADAMGRPEITNWRKFPALEVALAYAQALRSTSRG
jgi:hypothetical protein